MSLSHSTGMPTRWTVQTLTLSARLSPSSALLRSATKTSSSRAAAWTRSHGARLRRLGGLADCAPAGGQRRVPKAHRAANDCCQL
eukprot:UN2443